LVYLAIPDLMYNLFAIGIYGSYANQSFNPGFRTVTVSEWKTFDANDLIEVIFATACTVSNLYLNAVVSYEVLILLRNSHQTRRSAPPSLLKVTLQAAAVYSFAILVSIIFCLMYIASSKAEKKGDADKFSSLANGSYKFFVVSIMLPIIFVCSVCIIIWCRGYMPSMNGMSVRDRAMRELAWYFFRIIAVFFACWVPGIVCYVYSNSNRVSWGFQVALILGAIQPTLSTAMAMTKSDVRKYVFDLLTLSYVRTTTTSEAKKTRRAEELRTGTTNRMDTDRTGSNLRKKYPGEY